MSFRPAYYWYQDLQDSTLAKRFHLVEGRSRDFARHRMVVPRTWLPMSPLRRGEHYTPLSVFLENPELGDRSASISVCVCSVPTARTAAEHVVRSLGMTLHDWGDVEEGGSGRALGDETASVVAVRTSLGNAYVLVALAPRDRFAMLYPALNNAAVSFALRHAWAFDDDEDGPW